MQDKELIELMKDKAKSYVPEWRFDDEYMDIGTALALVYARMHSKTVNKFDQILKKYRVIFLNELNAQLLPAIPASGYVWFSLVNDEVEGVRLPANTVISAQSEETDMGVISYRTMDDVYVSPARLSAIFQTCDEEDTIIQVYSSGQEQTDLVLFDLKKPNLQKHLLYFAHEAAFYMKESAWIQLSFYQRGSYLVDQELIKKMADPESMRFTYSSASGDQTFEEVKYHDGTILLYKSMGQPPLVKSEVDGVSGYYIRCEAVDMERFRNLEIDRLEIRTWGREILPDSIYANGIESSRKRYFPFGERITTFNEVYFGSREVLLKKGAAAVLAFHLEFTKIPLDYNVENDPVKWEWIMKRADFKQDPEYDVTIEEVLWEYYNGTGWARLFPDQRYQDVFRPPYDSTGSYQKIEFICPDDLEPLVVNSCESCYIRARVMKVNNLFKMKGAYITPILENTIFEYDYQGREVLPEHMVSCNNLEYQQICRPAVKNTAFRPFTQTGIAKPALYLGFAAPLTEGPLKIYFKMKDNLLLKEPSFLWEYYNGSNWKELNLIDETRCFSKSGLVTMMGRPDFAKKRMFAKEQYWLRITILNQSYDRSGRNSAFPVVQGIYMNTTKVMNVDKIMTELLQMEIYQENRQFQLTDKKIIRAAIYVNEVNELTAGEMQQLIADQRMEPVYDQTGVLTEAWVRWNQKEDFLDSDEGSRDYVLDKNDGIIIFGNGRHGRIPPVSTSMNIRAEYLCGGGEHTNVPENCIRQLNQEVGFINQISNPEALTGGCNMETLNDALARNSARIRHQNRAITIRDYEDLAHEASRSIRRVRCFSGYDRYGRRCPGAITLVILQKDFRNGRGRFAAIKDEVENYLQKRADVNVLCLGRLAVIEPEFTELSVRAEIVVSGYPDAFQVKQQVYERLRRYLDPLTGNVHNQGWEIGQIPNNIQIKNAISNIPGLLFIRNLYISAFADGSRGRREVDPLEMARSLFVLPVSGQHEVIIEVG